MGWQWCDGLRGGMGGVVVLGGSVDVVVLVWLVWRCGGAVVVPIPHNSGSPPPHKKQ